VNSGAGLCSEICFSSRPSRLRVASKSTPCPEKVAREDAKEKKNEGMIFILWLSVKNPCQLLSPTITRFYFRNFMPSRGQVSEELVLRKTLFEEAGI